MLIEDAKNIPTCLDCIHCNEYVSVECEWDGHSYYCEKEMFELAPLQCWNCFELVTDENLPF